MGFSTSFYAEGGTDSDRYRPWTDEETQVMAELVLSTNPVIGFALSARDYNNNPTPLNFGLLVLSGLGLGATRALSRAGRFARVADEFGSAPKAADILYEESRYLHSQCTKASPTLLANIAKEVPTINRPALGIMRSSVGFFRGVWTVRWGADVLLVEALEEFVHILQVRAGKLGTMTRLQFEEEAKLLLINNASRLGLSPQDVRYLEVTLARYRIQLGAGVL